MELANRCSAGIAGRLPKAMDPTRAASDDDVVLWTADSEREQAETFLAGEEQDLDWDGDWGYLIAAHEIAGGVEPIGVGLFTYGTLQSMVPKGRRREF